MGIAVGCADLLVEAVIAKAPESYDRRWREMSRRYRVLCGAAVIADSSASFSA